MTPAEQARAYYHELGNRRAAMIRARNRFACACSAGEERFALSVCEEAAKLPRD